jgi:3-oxoacyl-[acyl-carrier-protein] synthase III
MSEAARKAMARADVSIDEIDYFVPHQANGRIIAAAQRQLGVPDAKMLSSVALYANSSAATIPLTLSLVAQQKPFSSGQKLLLSAAGAGLTGGAIVFEV